jgi:biotin transport system substrate-specific component
MPLATSTTESALPAVTAGFRSTLTGRLLIGFAATLVVAAAAHVAIPLPFTPVPLTLQPLAVLGVGLALGPVAGFFTMLAYLAEGACGLPVFSPTGPGGIAQLLGPTGGFLLAYPLVAAITGWFASRLRELTSRFLAALVAGHLAVAVLFLSGAGWFLFLTHLPVAMVFSKAVLPFLPGEIVKVFVAAGIYSTLSRPKAI